MGSPCGLPDGEACSESGRGGGGESDKKEKVGKKRWGKEDRGEEREEERERERERAA